MARVMEKCPCCEERFCKQGLPMHKRFCLANPNRAVPTSRCLHHFMVKAEEDEEVFMCVMWQCSCGGNVA